MKYHSIIQEIFFFLEICSLFSVLSMVHSTYFTCFMSSEALLHLSQLYFLTR